MSTKMRENISELKKDKQEEKERLFYQFDTTSQAASITMCYLK